MLRWFFKSLQIILMISIFVTWAACAPPPVLSPDDANSTLTAAAHTVQAQLTLASSAIPTFTRVVPTAAPTHTPTPLPLFTATPVLQTPTQITLTPSNTIPASPDQATIISQNPENSVTLAKDIDLDVVWILKNTGTSTWNEGYYVAFWGGDRIGQDLPTAYFLGKTVKPGEITNISVHMKTPFQAGTYKSIWFLINDQDKEFYNFNISFNVQ